MASIQGCFHTETLNLSLCCAGQRLCGWPSFTDTLGQR